MKPKRQRQPMLAETFALYFMNIPNETSIGNIANYYGGLSVKAKYGKHYWSIENYDGHDWHEIPESLYRSLLEYEAQRNSANVQHDTR